jgi:hypothetical protein
VSAKTPVWMKTACRLLIWKVVSKPGGVLAVFCGLLQSGNYSSLQFCNLM